VSDSRNTPRRSFLTRAAAATAAVVASSTAAATPLAAAIERGSGATRNPLSSDFDDTWTERVRAAKHRAVFDSPAVGDGLALEHASVFMNNYHEMFGTTDAETVAVIVMRHMGTALAVNDALWAKYELGKFVSFKDPDTSKDAVRNVFVRIGADAKNSPISAEASLSSLSARGAVLLACNRALMHLATTEATKRKQDLEKTKAEFRAAVLPGVILQPSGIYAVTRAQEAGCAFIKST
jgi:intracellular sulfur oxidation DsrE/DsrF family protein